METTLKPYAPVSLFSKPEVIPVQSLQVVAPETVTAYPANKINLPEFRLSTIDDQAVVMYGSDRQKEIGAALDGLLAEITKGNSPVLFELFTRLKKGVEETNLSDLEKSIRDSQNTKWYYALLDSLKLSSAAKRIQAASERISMSLTTKSKSLLDLTNSMEDSIQKEVLKLIADSQKLQTLASEYRKNVTIFGELVKSGKEILAQGKIDLAALEEKSKSGDPIDVENYKRFEQKVSLFENRLLVLETVYAQAPAELEAIRLSQGASLTVLGETASASLEEFNSIKSSLIKLSVVMQIKSVSSINDERRKLRNSLQSYGNELLGNVAVDAAKSQGVNRIADAQLLLDSAKKLNDISSKVLEEGKNNQARFAEARAKLEETRKLLS